MRNINLSLPEELIIEIDEIAKVQYLSRSECIRRILRKAAADRKWPALKKLKQKNPLDPRLLDLDDS